MDGKAAVIPGIARRRGRWHRREGGNKTQECLRHSIRPRFRSQGQVERRKFIVHLIVSPYEALREVVTRDGWSAAELIGAQKNSRPRSLDMRIVATVKSRLIQLDQEGADAPMRNGSTELVFGIDRTGR